MYILMFLVLQMQHLVQERQCEREIEVCNFCFAATQLFVYTVAKYGNDCLFITRVRTLN